MLAHMVLVVWFHTTYLIMKKAYCVYFEKAKSCRTNIFSNRQGSVGYKFCIKKFHQHLCGRYFIFTTNHKPLTYILHEKSLPQVVANMLYS